MEMKLIQFKHFNGTIADWQTRLAEHVFDNDVVFAKVWEQQVGLDPEWVCEYKIYAGKDAYGQEYLYNVADSDSLYEVANLVSLLVGDDWSGESILELIDAAIKAAKPTAASIVELIDNENSNVKVHVVDSSIVLTAASCEASITVGTDDPEVVVNPKNGDYYVKEVALADGSVMRTAYFYDGTNRRWVALDGNYDAEHVIINKAITLSGNYTTIGNMKRGDIIEAGTTVKSLFDNILSLEVYPENLGVSYSFGSIATAPAVYVYKAGTTTNSDSLVEVGTLVDTKATFGTQKVSEVVNASLFNNGTTKGYSTNKTQETYVDSEIFTLNLSSDVIVNTDTAILTLNANGFGGKKSDTSTYNNVVKLNGVAIKAGSNVFDASQTNITYTANWDNLFEGSLYAISNIGNYKEDKKVVISKENAKKVTVPSTQVLQKTNSKTIIGYWPIYWGYVTEGAATYNAKATLTVDYIKANAKGKQSAFNFPSEVSTITPSGLTKIYGVWFAFPYDNPAASVAWNVYNKATAAPINMASDTMFTVENMTGLNPEIFTDKKTYKILYWVNADYDYAANTYKIEKA